MNDQIISRANETPSLGPVWFRKSLSCRTPVRCVSEGVGVAVAAGLGLAPASGVADGDAAGNGAAGVILLRSTRISEPAAVSILGKIDPCIIPEANIMNSSKAKIAP